MPRYKCCKCDKEFNSKKKLTFHLTTVNTCSGGIFPTIQISFNCDRCGNKFTDAKSAGAHNCVTAQTKASNK